MLVDVLEEEWGTISSEIPAIMRLVLPSNPAAAGGLKLVK